jgi:hypothetical protein
MWSLQRRSSNQDYHSVDSFFSCRQITYYLPFRKKEHHLRREFPLKAGEDPYRKGIPAFA